MDPLATPHLPNGLINTIIQSCPHLKTLYIDGFNFHCYQDTRKTSTTLHSVNSGVNVSFDDNFFKYLSLKLPNLDCITIPIDSNIISTILMPSTCLKTMKIIWKIDEDDSDEENEGILVIFIITKNSERIFKDHSSYKFHGDCSRPSLLKREQEIKELKEPKRLKELPQPIMMRRLYRY